MLTLTVSLNLYKIVCKSKLEAPFFRLQDYREILSLNFADISHTELSIHRKNTLIFWVMWGSKE